MAQIPSPLKLALFQILLALAEDELHGYGIQRRVLENTDGTLTLWPAMLYRSLSKLEEAGLIRQVDAPYGEADDERKQTLRPDCGWPKAVGQGS